MSRGSGDEPPSPRLQEKEHTEIQSEKERDEDGSPPVLQKGETDLRPPCPGPEGEKGRCGVDEKGQYEKDENFNP
ncbi:hypothetical protein MASR2M17_04200 [Aminivibrio sp.]